MEAYVSTFKQCETTDLIHSGLPRSQAGLQALTERTKHITSYHNIHAYVQNQICPLLHLLNTTSCHHCTYTLSPPPSPQHYIMPPLHIYTVPSSISSTLHHATTAHIHCPLLHLLNTTLYHHCTYTLSPPPSPQHYIMPPLHIYTVPSSISSTLHHTTTAHIHCTHPPSPQHYIMPPLHIYTVPSSISSTLHHTTTAHIHCTHPPSPQHYIIPPLHTYTVPSSISSTLHHTTTAHIHCTHPPSPQHYIIPPLHIYTAHILHLLNTTSCHHCTHTLSPPPSPQHYTSSQVYLSILPDACGPSALSVRD